MITLILMIVALVALLHGKLQSEDEKVNTKKFYEDTYKGPKKWWQKCCKKIEEAIGDDDDSKDDTKSIPYD